MAPAKCVDCMLDPKVGDRVILRGGRGVTASGVEQELPTGDGASVEEVSFWEGDGAIYLVRLSTGEVLYASRARFLFRPDPHIVIQRANKAGQQRPSIRFDERSCSQKIAADADYFVQTPNPIPIEENQIQGQAHQISSPSSTSSSLKGLTTAEEGTSAMRNRALLVLACLAIGLGSVVATGYYIATQMAGTMEAR